MLEADIPVVRAFNRTVTRRLGALEESFHGRGRPLAACRLLFEIGPDGARLRDLRDRLGLDSGYLSRMLRGLEDEGFVLVRPSEADGRVREAALTDAGRAEWEALDGLSDGFARELLAPLSRGQRTRLVQAMAEVERLMRAAAVRIAPEPVSSPDARACLAQYCAELAARFEAGFDPARSVAAAVEDLSPPRGLFLLARLDGAAIGCAALKRAGDGVADVKRMWVAPGARGLGLGRRLLQALEAAAPDFGVSLLRLETNAALTEAQTLYRRSGFREVAPFSDEPYAHHWFEKPLTTRGGGEPPREP